MFAVVCRYGQLGSGERLRTMCGGSNRPTSDDRARLLGRLPARSLACQSVRLFAARSFDLLRICTRFLRRWRVVRG